MSDINLNGPANGGGAATSSGILFQQQLGAHSAAQILSDSRLDARLGLGNASSFWLRFETEAPVDNILVATSEFRLQDSRCGSAILVDRQQPILAAVKTNNHTMK